MNQTNDTTRSNREFAKMVMTKAQHHGDVGVVSVCSHIVGAAWVDGINEDTLHDLLDDDIFESIAQRKAVIEIVETAFESAFARKPSFEVEWAVETD